MVAVVDQELVGLYRITGDQVAKGDANVIVWLLYSSSHAVTSLLAVMYVRHSPGYRPAGAKLTRSTGRLSGRPQVLDVFRHAVHLQAHGRRLDADLAVADLQCAMRPALAGQRRPSVPS